jgi:hypothetical protein
LRPKRAIITLAANQEKHAAEGRNLGDAAEGGIEADGGAGKESGS